MLASAPSSAAPDASGRYARREPENTVLHRIVREHLTTFLATVREERGMGLPRYVEEELRRYLRCGILAHGFLRVVCPKCRQEIVVAYSCKCRGACPSCSARRMCDAAAHLVDHVLPDVPVRQWVLTAPHEVRRVHALRAGRTDGAGPHLRGGNSALAKATLRARPASPLLSRSCSVSTRRSVALCTSTSWCPMASSPARTRQAPSCSAKAPHPRAPTSRTSPRAWRSARVAGCAAAASSTNGKSSPLPVVT